MDSLFKLVVKLIQTFIVSIGLIVGLLLLGVFVLFGMMIA